MNSDPFEKGRAAGKELSDRKQAASVDSEKIRKTSIERIDAVLNERFAPYSHFKISSSFGEVEISWLDSYKLSVKPASTYIDGEVRYIEGYNVIYTRTLTDIVSEQECSEARVLELAGEYFGLYVGSAKPIDKSQNEPKSSDEPHGNKNSNQRSASSFIWLIVFGVLALLVFSQL